MKKIKFIVALIVFLIAFNAASATNLRGQLLRFLPQTGQYFPLANVQVNLWILNPAGQWVNLGYTFTDSFGFYYFNNVAANYIFQIQVYGTFKLDPALTVLEIYPPYYQDVPQIVT